MSHLEEPTQEQVAAWDARDRKAAQWLTVTACAAVAFVFGYLQTTHRDFTIGAARGLGFALGVLTPAAVIAFFVSRTSERWHYAFAVASLVVLALVTLGSRGH